MSVLWPILCAPAWIPPFMSAFDIGADAVHIWRVALDRSERLEGRRALLSGDERARAARFRFDRDRDRWTIAHGALRRILGAYLAQEPKSLRFELGKHGKPGIAGSSLSAGLEFNLSHSEAFALIAVTRGGPVGVDLERTRPEITWEDCRAVFTPHEQALLDAAPDKVETFFRLWTRKEAFVKAGGRGLSAMHDQVTLRASKFTIHDLTPAEGYLGAVAVLSGVTDVIQFNDD